MSTVARWRDARHMVALLCGTLLPWCCQAGGADALAMRGERIFHGREVLKLRLSGQSEALSGTAIACAACHAHKKSTALENYSAPRLTRTLASARRAPRGGPGFMYDKASFCRAIQTGIDPTHIVLKRTMPRYALDDGQCSALWQYINTLN